MAEKKPPSIDLSHVRARVHEKQEDYRGYGFSKRQDDILKIFFDLAQEYDSLEDFYRTCVTVPGLCLDLDVRLYLFNRKLQKMELVCDSTNGLAAVRQSASEPVHPELAPYRVGNSYFFPVFKKNCFPEEKEKRKYRCLSGLLEVQTDNGHLSQKDQLFFTKYAGRVAFRLHNRVIARQNIDHLKFINNLVRDIEHNVIIPNMYFRYLFNQLRKKIRDLGELKETVLLMKDHLNLKGEECQMVLSGISKLHKDLLEYHEEVQKQHANLSLFLESLFRKDHFAKGRLVLRPKKCLVEKAIIGPQLEYYAKRFQGRQIEIVRPSDMRDEEIPLMVDIGLLAQVYANLFSNAVKYTGEVVGLNGRIKKKMAYGRHYMPDAFGPGIAGVKFNVFTTGPHLSDEDGENIFSEGYRAAGSSSQSGSGHGLNFIKHVIEIHGGRVGYESTHEGNNFYFILPLPETDG
ncbi:MAG: ATP-binding protein [Thermodesulfobacteriota bacterium]|nr:ATP-binding protein [Thermodesulfobacteriota bacterium]